MKKEEKNKLKNFLEDFQDLMKVNHILLSNHSKVRYAIDTFEKDNLIKQLFEIKTIQNLVENAEVFAKLLEMKKKHKGDLYKETINLINKFKPLYNVNETINYRK